MRSYVAYLVSATILSVASSAPLAAQSAQPAAPKNCAANAAGGAVLGGLVGGLLAGKHDRGKGALIGAAIGGAAGGLSCIAFNSKVAHQRSNAQVREDYGSQLAEATQPTLINYETAAAARTYKAGDDIVVQSHIVVATPPRKTSLPIQERYTVYTPDGKTKQFVKDVAQSGGEMTNQLTFTLPAAMPKGTYKVESELVVDGKSMGSNQSQFRLA